MEAYIYSFWLEVLLQYLHTSQNDDRNFFAEWLLPKTRMKTNSVKLHQFARTSHLQYLYLTTTFNVNSLKEWLLSPPRGAVTLIYQTKVVDYGAVWKTLQLTLSKCPCARHLLHLCWEWQRRSGHFFIWWPVWLQLKHTSFLQRFRRWPISPQSQQTFSFYKTSHKTDYP